MLFRSDTYVYVADSSNYRIVKRLKSDLSYVSKIGTYGSGDDQFNNPSGVAVDENYVYVANTDLSRISLIFSNFVDIDSDIWYYFVADYASGQRNTTGYDKRSRYILPNKSEIWDFSGNVFEIIDTKIDLNKNYVYPLPNDERSSVFDFTEYLENKENYFIGEDYLLSPYNNFSASNIKYLLKRQSCEPEDEIVSYYLFKGGLFTEFCSTSYGLNINPYSSVLLHSAGRSHSNMLGFRCVYVE